MILPLKLIIFMCVNDIYILEKKTLKKMRVGSQIPYLSFTSFLANLGTTPLNPFNFI